MRLSKLFGTRDTRNRRQFRRLNVQLLERRELLAGLVMEQSVFNVGLFAENIEDQVPVDINGPNGVVGYSYAVIDGDPDNPISNAGGIRRMVWDTPPGVPAQPWPASPEIAQEIASVSKAITGAASMHLMQEKSSSTAAMEALLQTPAANFLPTNWSKSPFFYAISVQDLLTHTSGIQGPTVAPAPDAYQYGSLQLITANFSPIPPLNGQPWYRAFPEAPSYFTTNFAYFRVMLPYMWDAIENTELDFNAATSVVTMSALVPDDTTIRSELEAAFVEDWNAGLVVPVPGSPLPDTYALTPDKVTASIYKYYVSKYILEPSGVTNPQTKPTGVAPTLLYPLDPTVRPGSREWGPVIFAPQPGQNTGDQTLKAGSRGWNLSAEDVARVFTGIRHGAVDGSVILEEDTLRLMDERGLGWRLSTNAGGFTGDFGQYYGHDGVNFSPTNLTLNAPTCIGPSGCTGNPPTLGPANNTIAIAFPNDIEAAVLINSQIQSIDGPSNPTDVRTQVVIGAAFNANSPTSNGPAAIGTNTAAALINAYDNAWTELVYDGYSATDVLEDPTVPSASDTFILRRNTAVPNSDYIDLVHIDSTGTTIATITRRADTLEKLTLNGLIGNDTFNIQWLPAGLELVINGGPGSDTVTVGGIPGAFDLDNTPGTLTFVGGFGTDTLTIDDSNQGAGTSYTVTDDYVTRFGTGTYNFFDIDTVNLNTSSNSDTIDVNRTLTTITTNINAASGDDTIHIGAVGTIDLIQGAVNVTAGSGTDTLILTDIFSGTGNDYEVDSTQTIVDDSVTITYDAENIQIKAGGGNDSIEVNSLTVSQDLDVNTGTGENDVSINLLSNPLSTSVNGKVVVNGGGGAGDTLTVNDATSLNETDYTVTKTTVHRTGIPSIEYGGIGQLDLNGAIPASTYKIQATSTVTNVTGGILGDFFDIGLFRLDLIDGLLTINGGDNIVGEDTVVFDDLVGTSPLYGIVNNALFGFTFATIFLNDVEQATLDGNGLDNQILIENADGPTRYTVNGGSGVDTFSLAGGSENLMNFATPLILNGGPLDDNHLILHDAASPGSLSFTVTANSIDRLFFGERSSINSNIGVTFSSMTDVELYMNEYSSNVNVHSTNPSTKYIFHASEGDDTLNLLRHLDQDVDPIVDIDGTDITSAAMDIEHDGFEQLNLNLGDEQSTVRIHNLHSPAAINLGLGDDRLFITPDSGNLGAIHHPIVVDGQGGDDRLHLYDDDYGSDAQYTVTKNSVDRFLFGPLFQPGVTYLDFDFVRLFMGSGASEVSVVSTAPGTEYLLDGAAGDDTFYVNALPISPLTLFGGIGSDHAVITGTAADDEVSISAGFGAAEINMPSVETATFDGLEGTDGLVAEGVVGSAEQMEVEATASSGAGNLKIITSTIRGASLLDLMFENTEILDLLANKGDTDTAKFVGTDEDDVFNINLGSQGTLADPVLSLMQPGANAPLLMLRDYRNFGTLTVEGRDGADDFDVFVSPDGPGTGHRNLFIDGGSPSGPGNSRDELTVFWESMTPTIPPTDPPLSVGSPVDHDQVLDRFFIDYDSLHQFTVDYIGIEKAKSKNVNAAG